MLTTSTLRPGLLVSLKTSLIGNATYRRQDIEADHTTAEGSRKMRWETERTITDPAEHEAAIKVRGKASSLIRGVCAHSAFGLLCPEADADKLTSAITEARALIDQFNAQAKLSRVHVYVIAGRVAPDDVEAVKAINSEVRDLLADMAEGLKNLDVSKVREAAGRAKSIGTMLTPAASARIQIAIDAARGAARQIVKSGEQAAGEIDIRAIRAITETRTAFLDLDSNGEVQAPTETARAVDFTPEESTPPEVQAVAAPQPRFEF